MKKKKETIEVIEKIFDYTLEDIMGQRFGSYSKYIIQDRAIPDARDGLKPVQRRILYSMHREKNTYDKGYRKSAKTVGDVIGNFHPHGDTSIYDAMVRMSQPWKQRLPFIDMHGNNGSIDGDSPAAYRYTEARLSKIAEEMLRDIDKDTVEFAPNFDDTLNEPTVLPARFPALLVYGAQGISAGYATNIPTHNLNEVVNACIYRIDNPNCTLEELMEFVKGPDFPTGAIALGKQGIIDAYTTGRGKIIIKSKVELTDSQIIITEIPFEVNKANMVKKIDEIRLDKKVDGIIEVRDESTNDVRVVIDIKKNANKELILNYLYKNTDMQISYSFNVVAIVNKRPKLLGLAACLDAFINHQKEVITRRTKFDLDHARARYHIVEGLIKCISILDEVIKVIRASKNKIDAKDNLVKEFDFTEVQAEAIVTLQLYRLTNTDVVMLEEEKDKLSKIIEGLTKILESEKELKKVMKRDLTEVNKNFVTPRLTEIKDEFEEIKIDKQEMIVSQDVMVAVTHDGYVKRCSTKSFNSSNIDDIQLKENDYVTNLFETNTKDVLLLFTSLGNYLYIPINELPDSKYKDLPKHISNIIGLDQNEEIIGAFCVNDFNKDINLLFASSNGMIKKCELKLFKAQRYNKPICAMKLKDDDKLVSVIVDNKENIFFETSYSYSIVIKNSDFPSLGLKAAGVKGIKLKTDKLVSISSFDSNDSYISIFTDKGTTKRIKLEEFELSKRATRGVLTIRNVKTNPYKIVKALISNSKSLYNIKTDKIETIKSSDIPISDRYSIGSKLFKNIVDVNYYPEVSTPIDKVIEKKENTEIDLNQIDEKLMKIDDFL